MTLAQTARTLGFNASLQMRGVLLSLGVAGPTLTALVEPAVPAEGEFVVSERDRNMSRVHVLRSALTGGLAAATVGSVWLDAVNGKRHRVTEVEDNPTSIATVFNCETSND